MKMTIFILIVSLISVLCLNNAAAITYYYMDNYCNGTLDMSFIDAVRLKLTSRSSYKPNMACSLLITSTRYADKYMLYFKDIDIESNINCNHDWLEVHDGSNIYSPYVSGISGRLCGSYISSAVRRTSGNNMYLYFRSDGSWPWQNRGFDMVITRYHTGFCNNDEYSCDNGRCVSDSLICNGYNPCGDYSDCATEVITGGVIAGIVVGSFCVAVIVVTCLVILRRRRRLNRHYHQPVQAVTTTTNYGTGYNQPVPQQYPSVNYPTGQQYPQSQYPN